MSKFRRQLAGGLITATLASQLAAAPGHHSLSEIAATAARALHARAADRGYDNLDVQVRPLDTRLTLSRCDRPITVLPAKGSRVLGPVSAGIRCDGKEPWTLYVRGQVSAAIDLPVLATPVARGEIVSEADLTVQKRRIVSDLVGFISDKEDIVGKEAKRNLVSGKSLRFGDLKAPVLVERGQIVDIVSGIGGLTVAMEGKALASGGRGDRVAVANTRTGKRLEGVVSASGSVLVD